MTVMNPTLPAFNQASHAQLFRLPYELRYRIYQYILTPAHVHIERKVDYMLTPEGIKVVNPNNGQEFVTASQGHTQGSASLFDRDPSRDNSTRRVERTASHSDEESENDEHSSDGEESEYNEEGSEVGENDNDDNGSDGDGSDWYQESDASLWSCSKLFSNSNSTEFQGISSTYIDGGLTQQQARSKLFRIYYCRSQKLGGPSAVPPGYLDHQECDHEKEQTDFEGSTIAGLRATCQWAYNETLTVAATTAPSVSFRPFLTGAQPRLELPSHTLHFSDLKDLACFTGLISQEVSESLHSLSVHVSSMYNEYWPYFCNIYLRPWSRITLSDWLRDPLDKTANITFYHNHTTHDLADPTVSGDEEWHGWGERTGRREIAEALASDWVVPNIQIQSSSGNSWSTKFRMSALNQREGGPLDLRLSFPLFLHREELQSRYCLDSMNGWEEDPRDCRLISNPHSESEHHNPNWFDSRRWLSERHGEMTIAKREQRKTLRPLWHGCEDGDNTAEQALLEDEEEWLQPGSPHCICEMEQQLCLTTWQMNEILELKIWLKAHEGQGHEDWLTKLCLFEKSFQENFLAKRRDAPGHVALLRHVHPSLQHMDDCQGLESLDIDFFGDALSPGTAKEIHTTATSIFRDGLVERFTGREWRGRENLERPVSVFWDIGPHPEPNFTRWADPNHNMDGLNMDDRWR